MKKEGFGLSRIASGAWFLTILLGVITLVMLVLLLVTVWPAMSNGVPLLYLLDELDDEIGSVFMMAVGTAVCGCASLMLRRKQRQEPQAPDQAAE